MFVLQIPPKSCFTFGEYSEAVLNKYYNQLVAYLSHVCLCVCFLHLVMQDEKCNISSDLIIFLCKVSVLPPPCNAR